MQWLDVILTYDKSENEWERTSLEAETLAEAEEEVMDEADCDEDDYLVDEDCPVCPWCNAAARIYSTHDCNRDAFVACRRCIDARGFVIE